MKVLFISHHLKGNDGWSRYASDLIAGIQHNGAEVLCLVNEIDSKTNIPQKACLKKEPLAYVANPFISFFNAFKINTIIKDYQPDIIHIIVEPYGTIIPFLKRDKAKIVLSAHSTFAFMPILVSGFRRLILNCMTRRMYAKTDLVICVSEYTKQHLIRHMAGINVLSLVENKIAVLSGGVDLSKFMSQRKQNTPSANEILFVGAIKPRKGLKEAIEALALVKTDYIFRIVGRYNENDPYFLLLKQKIKELNIAEKIVFVGQVSDEELQKLYDKADLFLMLSTNNGADFEGYGLVYLEANAYGVPCIGPSDSGVADAIVSGKTGYLVNQYDSCSVAKIIDNVLQNDTIKAENCIAWAWENRNEVKAKKIFEIYNKLLS